MRPPRSTSAGFTLVEVMITVTLMTVVIGSVLTIGLAGSNAFRTGSVRNEMETSARRCLDRLSHELLSARQGSIAALPETPDWDNEIVFDQFDGVSAADGTASWVPVRLAFRYEAGEVDDGLDNDNDGLIDEGEVVMTRDWGAPDALTTVMCKHIREFSVGETLDGNDENGNQLVDDRGFSFERDGNYLTIRIAVERFDYDGRLMTTSFDTSVWIRN